MGTVYAARAPSGAAVAVKVLHSQRARDPYMVERFATEAFAGARIRDRHVVRVIDRGVTSEGIPFLVMLPVAGEPLGRRVSREGRLPLRRAAAITRQILDGLAAIHRAGFIHGDVKTGNVMVAPDDTAVLIDLGLARRATAPHVRTGMIAGTPEYLAPEVASGGPPTPAADVYGAGIVLYELISGATPFTGTTSREILHRQIADDVTPPSLLDAELTIPPELERIVLRALAKRPADRFPSAAAFAAALANALPHLDAERGPAGTDAQALSDRPTLDWRAACSDVGACGLRG